MSVRLDYGFKYPSLPRRSVVHAETGAEADAFISGLLRAGVVARVTGGTGADPGQEALRVRRLMRAPPPALDPEAPLGDAERLFHACDAEWLPVMEHGQLVGVLRHRDVTRELLRAAPGRKTAALPERVDGDG